MRLLFLAIGCWSVGSVQAQSGVTQNNLLANGGFDSGSASWSTASGGIYYYTATPPNPDNQTNTIVSWGWWDGTSVYQASTSVFEPNVAYTLTAKVRVGQATSTGVNLSVQDPTLGWADVSNQDFIFPVAEQSMSPGPWHIFTLNVGTNANVGDTIAAGISLRETPNTQYGWLHVDWVQLAPTLPEITAQPQGLTNYAGASAFLNVAAVGAVTNDPGALQFQWFKTPATPVAGATNNELMFTNLDITNSGDYYVVATGSFGSIQSSNATLGVLPANPPIVSTAEASQMAYIHQTVRFAVQVAGTPPFTYQWASNSIPIAGATNSTLTLTNISAASAGTYSVGITNAIGGTSTNVDLTVTTPVPGTYEAAAIGLLPQVYLRFSGFLTSSNTINEGTVGASADATVEGSYAGTYGPMPPDYPNFEDTNSCAQYDGYDTDTIIPPLNFSNNVGNTVSMCGWIYTYGLQANYAGILFERDGGASGLQVQVDTNSQNILSYDWANGSHYTFQSGLVIPDYQWCYVALVITPTNATLYLRDANAMHVAVDTATEGSCTFAGNTWVGWDPAGGASGRRFNGLIDETAIFNRALTPTEVNSLYSAAVGQPAGLVSSSSSLTNYTGHSFHLAVVASGAPPLAFQWFKDGNAITNATNETYSVASATTADSGDYYVHVQNTAGSTNSEMATVSIQTSAPFFTAPPQPSTVWSGVPSSLSGSVNGSLPVAYQWFKNNSLLPGETNAILYFADPEAPDDADYVLLAQNSYGQTNSTAVHLSVEDPAKSAQMLYYTNTTSVWNLRNNYQPIQGVWFETGNKNRIVTHLGYFDSTGAGLSSSHYVGIYQGPPGSGTLLAQVQVPAGTDAPYLNGFRWVALSQPFVLQANTNYVLAASDNNTDLWPDAYLPAWNSAYVGVTDGSTRYPVYDSTLAAWPHEPNTPITSWGLDLTYGAFNLGSFPFTLSYSGGGTQLTWTLGTLQSSTNVAGPYQDVPGAVSPFTLPMTGPSQFYRIKY